MKQKLQLLWENFFQTEGNLKKQIQNKHEENIAIFENMEFEEM